MHKSRSAYARGELPIGVCDHVLDFVNWCHYSNVVIAHTCTKTVPQQSHTTCKQPLFLESVSMLVSVVIYLFRLFCVAGKLEALLSCLYICMVQWVGDEAVLMYILLGQNYG